MTADLYTQYTHVHIHPPQTHVNAYTLMHTHKCAQTQTYIHTHTRIHLSVVCCPMVWILDPVLKV